MFFSSPPTSLGCRQRVASQALARIDQRLESVAWLSPGGGAPLFVREKDKSPDGTRTPRRSSAACTKSTASSQPMGTDGIPMYTSSTDRPPATFAGTSGKKRRSLPMLARSENELNALCMSSHLRVSSSSCSRSSAETVSVPRRSLHELHGTKTLIKRWCSTSRP